MHFFDKRMDDLYWRIKQISDIHNAELMKASANLNIAFAQQRELDNRLITANQNLISTLEHQKRLVEPKLIELSNILNQIHFEYDKKIVPEISAIFTNIKIEQAEIDRLYLYPVTHLLYDHYNNGKFTDFFTGSFIDKLINEIDSSVYNFDPNVEGQFEVISNAYVDKSNTLQPSRLNYKGLFDHFKSIITIVSFVLAVKNELKKDHPYINEINNVQITVEPKIEQLNVYQKNEKIFVIPEIKSVFASNDSSSNILGIILPNQEYQVLSEKDNWKQIEYFDYINANQITGWINFEK